MILLITSVVLLFYYYKQNSIPHPTTSTVLNKVAGLIEEPSDTGLGNIADKEENNVAKEDSEDLENVDEDDDEKDSNHAEEENYENAPEKPVQDKMKTPRTSDLKFQGPQNERQRAVVSSFQHAWQGYRTYAWGKDHLKPISKTHQTW